MIKTKICAVMFTLVALASGLAWGAVPAQQAVDAFASGGSVDAASAGVVVIDLATGKMTGALNAEQALVPASVMKCVTTATLLESVGEDWRYETPVWLAGHVRDGVLDGDLVVEGSADPSLGSVHEPGSTDIVAEIVGALKAKGIRRITGTVRVDESRFGGPPVNPTWASGDLPHAYGTGTHGFNYEDNASGKRSVQDPAAVFLSRLKGALDRAGIERGEEAKGTREDERGGRKSLLGRHRSETVDEIMRSCMMRSDNQYAEGLLRTVSSEQGGDGSTADAAQREMKYWKHKRMPMDEVRIVDGSGLSRSNRLTPVFLARVLEKMAPNPHYASFFPLAGQEGTLKRFMAGTELEGYVAMKTGSMRGIQCYAGYKLDDYYAPTHVIVVMINNMSDRGRAREGVRKLLENIFL